MLESLKLCRARRSTSGTGKSGRLGKEGTTSSEIGKEGTKSSEMGKEGMKSSGMGKEGAQYYGKGGFMKELGRVNIEGNVISNYQNFGPNLRRRSLRGILLLLTSIYPKIRRNFWQFLSTN